MAVFGIGMDLADTARFKRILEGSSAEGFIRKIFTDQEKFYCSKKANPAESYAARFAAKEAFIKASGLSSGLCWKEIEVVTDSKGCPALKLSGSIEERIRKMGITAMHLTCTHDGNMAGAFVILEK